MNDDAKEKVNRRKSSGKYSLVSVARETAKNTINNVNTTNNSTKQQPILANFEQWMKLVKDNKINATNSWNFALIDYFHDMSLLKEGDGINFQKASYTLDGCVKIYTSRVDSAATETGKLLSGLADSNKQQLAEADYELGQDEEDDDDDNEGGGLHGETKSKKTKKARNRSEHTIVNSFEQIQSKKLELELAIDPLFRKMCSDFDEGGAKGLLLNSLVIDKTGRVVFDGELDEEDGDVTPQHEVQLDDNHAYIDVSALRDRYFEDLSRIDNMQVCPSVKNINSALNDPALHSSTILKDLEGMTIEEEDQSFGEGLDKLGGILGDEDDFGSTPGGYGGLGADDNDFADVLGGGDDGDLDDEASLSFGVPNAGPKISSNNSFSDYGGYGISPAFVLNPSFGPTNDNNILSYFDETLKKNWAGPEHWKIRKFKGDVDGTNGSKDNNNDEQKSKRKERVPKQQFVIDFLSDGGQVDEKLLFAESGSSINLPKSQQKSKNRNLLPDDRHFSSKNLIKLFLKPRGRIIHSKIFGQVGSVAETEADAGFWAEQYQQPESDKMENNGDDGEQGGYGDYDDNDYGGYDGYTEVTKTQLHGETSPNNDLIGNATRRARPEYLNYAKTAKRVNVKLLKNNIWKVLDLAADSSSTDYDGNTNNDNNDDDADDNNNNNDNRNNNRPHRTSLSNTPTVSKVEVEKKFTDVAQDLKKVYPGKQMSEISTSFCFICVLHLANEKGLVIEDNDNHDDLTIKWDQNAFNTTDNEK